MNSPILETLETLTERQLEAMYTAQAQELRQLWKAKTAGDQLAPLRIANVQLVITAIDKSLNRFLPTRKAA